MRLEMTRGLEGHVKDVGKSVRAGEGCEHICASKRSRSLLHGEKVKGLKSESGGDCESSRGW